MVEWTKEAIEAAIKAFAGRKLSAPEDRDDMRAALDAAVKAQLQQNSASYSYQMAYSSGRAEALEEAMKVANKCRVIGWKTDIEAAVDGTAKHIAAQICALKSQPSTEPRPPIYPGEWEDDKKIEPLQPGEPNQMG